MPRPNIVAVLTTNPAKFAEVAQTFAPYGVTCVKDTVTLGKDVDVDMFSRQPELRLVVAEQTRLTRRLQDVKAEVLDNEEVTHTSALRFWHRDLDGTISTGEYVVSVHGSLLPAKDIKPSQLPVYNWDNRFVPEGSTLTYQEMKEKGLKVSARQQALGYLIRQCYFYTEPVTWKHTQVSPNSTTDTGITPQRWLDTQELFNLPTQNQVKLYFQQVVNQGIFFKAASNRRERNYWLPGLNAGVPLTPKKDSVHEATFLAHDLFHFLMPDLIYDGSNTEGSYRCYVLSRMLSEAMTMVMADMVYVDTLKQSGITYEYSSRRIHPLFKPEVALRDQLHANMRLALFGDESGYKKMGIPEDALTAFLDKYAPFFEEDYRWTAANATSMAQRSAAITPWAQWVRGFNDKYELGLWFVGDVSDMLSAGDVSDEALSEALFELFFTKRLFGGKPPNHRLTAVQQEAQAFRRWLLGQLCATFVYDAVPLSKAVRVACEPLLAAAEDPQARSEAKALFNSYISALCGLNLIQFDEASTYKEIFPVFPPFYVNYDADKNNYAGIAATWEKVRFAPASWTQQN